MRLFGLEILKASDYNNLVNTIIKCDGVIGFQDSIIESLKRRIYQIEYDAMITKAQEEVNSKINEEIIINEMLLNLINQRRVKNGSKSKRTKGCTN
jgi:hypothetical protein